MTKNEEHEKRDPRQVAVQAVHLISDILEEACIIAGSVTASNPWRYMPCLKRIHEKTNNQNMTYVLSSDNLRNSNFHSPVLTSTPEKGQGDQESASNHDEMVKSTSMFITQLFDMSELEGADDVDFVEDKKESDLSLIEYISEMVDKCIHNTVNETIACNKVESDRDLSEEACSSYSLLSDAIDIKENNDQTLFIEVNHNKTTTKTDVNNDNENDIAIEKSTNEDNKIEEYGIKPDKSIHEINYLKDLCTYEISYSTLNYDFDQCGDIIPTLQDPKMLSLQEIDLRSQEGLNEDQNQKNIELPTTSKDCAAGKGPCKSNLLRRCRVQGKRWFARCRSWWWRRRSIKKYKVHHGAERGSCHLSPDARRRATSLMENLQMPPPSHCAWKFNTISEAFVHSAIWKQTRSKLHV